MTLIFASTSSDCTSYLLPRLASNCSIGVEPMMDDGLRSRKVG